MGSTARRRSSTTTTSASAGTPRRTSHWPGFILAVGVGFLILFIVALMTQIQTNEAFITNQGQVSIYKPNWEVLLQVPLLIAGGLSPSEAVATIFGWGIELIYLGFIIGYELLQEAAYRSGQAMGNLFRVCSWAIVLFNGWTDFNYGTLGGGLWGHIFFAAVTSFIVGFFLTIGIFLIECGWQRA